VYQIQCEYYTAILLQSRQIYKFVLVEIQSILKFLNTKYKTTDSTKTDCFEELFMHGLCSYLALECAVHYSSFMYKFSAFHCGCSSSVSFPSVAVTCLNVDISEEQTASIFRVSKLK
jgi:hypothetical protein